MQRTDIISNVLGAYFFFLYIYIYIYVDLLHTMRFKNIYD